MNPTKKQKKTNNNSDNTTKKVETAAVTGIKSNSLFEVVAGSYEKILYGLKLTINKRYQLNKEAGKKETEETDTVKNTEPQTENITSLSHAQTSLPFTLSPEFIFPAHLGCIRTIHVGSSRYLASGSSDEIIKLYDMKTRKELGSLSDHVGTITCLKFVGKAHMLSASEDGTLLIWRTKDWEILKNLKGHKGRISSVSPHPSGKLALSVGDDRLLLAWNLMTGQRASSTRLSKSAILVDWAPIGNMYALMFDEAIHIYAISSPEPFCKIAAPSGRAKFMSLAWIFCEEKQYLSVGCSDGSIHLYGPIELPSETSSEEIITQNQLGHLQVSAHSVRIKAHDVISMPDAELPRLQILLAKSKLPIPSQFLITASSDGLILVWNLSELLKLIPQPASDSATISLTDFTKGLFNKCDISEAPKEPTTEESLIVASYHSKVRLTCLTSNFPFF